MKMEGILGEYQNKRRIIKEMHFIGVEKNLTIYERLKSFIGDIQIIFDMSYITTIHSVFLSRINEDVG